jgi:hypothetical protein
MMSQQGQPIRLTSVGREGGAAVGTDTGSAVETRRACSGAGSLQKTTPRQQAPRNEPLTGCSTTRQRSSSTIERAAAAVLAAGEDIRHGQGG